MPKIDLLAGMPAEEAKRVSKKLLLLREQLNGNVPSRAVDSNFLLATWNIREFDSEKYGGRTDESYLYLAEIISRFDLVAVQEVREDLSALNKLLAQLGDWWKFIYTDVTEGSKGNRERMAFLFDSRKVTFSGLAGEIVIPEKGTMQPSEQLARTPFLVGFQSGWFKFMVCTVHIYYGTDAAEDPDRVKEIKLIAQTLKQRATDNYTFSHNLILLGDFNIFSPGDVTFKAITDAGFWIPDSIQKLPSNAPQNKHYDQIAFISPDLKSQLTNARAGVFNFLNHLYLPSEEQVYVKAMGPGYEKKSSGGTRNVKEKSQYYSDWVTHQLSDHLPMWVELVTDFSNERLRVYSGDAAASPPGGGSDGGGSAAGTKPRTKKKKPTS